MAATKDTLVYLNIEIGDQELKAQALDMYNRGRAFFETHGALYGYAGRNLEDLDVEDRQNLQDIYDSNPVLTKGGQILLSPPAPLPGGRLVIRLDTEGCPKTSDNFLAFAESRFAAQVKGATYMNTQLFRLVPNHIIQGGDFTKNDGSGGHSIYPTIDNPRPFADERNGLKKNKFVKRGILAMANRGKNTNGSQFFLTIGEGTRWSKTLDGNYVAFGEVLEDEADKASAGQDNVWNGIQLLDQLNKVPTDEEERPIRAVTIVGCGRLGSK
ncbi:Peptidyl-prolyl cis-trans isomerase cyp40 [Actinomortierella ambigua]|nr:Peptidyl-prolyl cis-trans isomerase cyp40 [Actinomortierella ambigua]